jgi:hypothetical protein
MNDKLTAVGVELLPCPFCGKTEPVRRCDNNEDDSNAGNDLAYAVVCDFNLDGCGGSSGYAEKPSEAVRKWNERLRERSEKPLAHLDLILTALAFAAQQTSSSEFAKQCDSVYAELRSAPSPVCAEPGCDNGLVSDGWETDDDGHPAIQRMRDCPRCQPAADAPRYSCYVEGCPGNHASKYLTCGELPKPEPGAEQVTNHEEAYIYAQFHEHDSNLARCYLDSRASLDDARRELGEMTKQRDGWKRLDDAHIQQSNAIATRLRGELEKAEAENARLREALNGFTGFWRSGNNVPVERAVIRSDHPVVIKLYETLK